jgi:hypothetical protein
MTFEEFLAHLPTVSQDLAIEATASSWADYVLEPDPRFVPPPLVEAVAVADGTSVVVVSAAGAVGKSTLGREIAFATGAPFLNLATRRVGHAAAVGLITTMFGYAQVPEAFQRLADGRLMLVFDALDETRVRSREGNFDAFLEDLAGVFKAPRPNPVLVLLARSETAEWAQYFLTESGVHVARYSIDFFDESGSREFVTRYVERSVNIEPEPFARVRDELLEGIRTALTGIGSAEDEGTIRSVLGYAPMLRAISDYLVDDERRRNYHRLLQALQREGREGDLLTQAAEDILDREQEKRIGDLQGRLSSMPATFNEWGRLYTRDEQIERLLAMRFGLLQPPPPSEVPASLRQEYQEAIAQALEEHPFRGSVEGLHPVFGEYLYGWVLANASWPGALRARESLRDSTYLPTPGLAWFLLALTTRSHNQPSVAARDFGFLYESIQSQEQIPGDVTVRIGDASGDALSVWVNTRGRTLEFSGREANSGLWLWRRLAYAHVGVSCDVALGASGGEFALGPSVYLDCSRLAFPAAEYRIYTGSGADDEAVTLVADALDAIARAPVVLGTGFAVSGASVPWPWSDYSGAPPERGANEEALRAAYNHLARILLWFRAGGYPEIARVDELVIKAAAGRSPVAQALLDFCVDRGLILRGRLYTLNEEALTDLGINYSDLRHRVLRDPVRTLLREFLSSTS